MATDYEYLARLTQKANDSGYIVAKLWNDTFITYFKGMIKKYDLPVGQQDALFFWLLPALEQGNSWVKGDQEHIITLLDEYSEQATRGYFKPRPWKHDPFWNKGRGKALWVLAGAIVLVIGGSFLARRLDID